jgi:hypothetical protein
MRTTIAIALLAISTSARAQGVRISGVTSVQAVDRRPLVEDSVPVTEASGSGPYRVLPDGQVVRCVIGEPYCRFRSSGDREMVAPLVQDLRLIGWGLGEGISVFSHVRFRGSLGANTADWPRSDDAFDAIEAWVEIDRRPGRARLGRQWASSGLGVFNYDGLSLLLRRGRASAEIFGGRSLVAGLNEPATGPGLAELNDLPPDENGWLIGISGLTPVASRGNVSATWQRVIRADRAALYSDRLAADGAWRAFGGSADFSLAWDISAQNVNEARLQLARPLGRGFSASVQGRRFRPFFEAWTIWGAFSPVAFGELRGEVTWRNLPGWLSIDARGAWRQYDETNAGLESQPLKDGGWRAGAGVEWTPRPQWVTWADYDVDIGFGASRSDIVAGARWMPDESRWFGVVANGLQHIYEFRVGTGRVNGVRLEGGTRITPEIRLIADAALYSHHQTGGAPSPDWSQRRFSVRFDWTVGRDPGASVVRNSP